MSVAKEFEAANANYVASFTKGDLQLPPQRCVDIACSNSILYYPSIMQKTHLTLFIRFRKIAVVACMDARLGPYTLRYL